MRTTGLFVLCALFIATGNGAPVEKRRESTQQILELESLLKKSAGEDKQVFPSELKKEAKAKEAKLAAEAEELSKDTGVDIPAVPPEMQIDGLAEHDELEAQLKLQQEAQDQSEQESETEGTDEEQSKDDESNVEQQEVEEDTEEEPEIVGEVEQRERELFLKYLKESPELWQQLMESLESSEDAEWNRGGYVNPDDEYAAVMQEWQRASENDPRNYIAQYDYPRQFYPDTSTDEETELESKTPKEEREFSNMEELQEYYGDKQAKEGAKKRGFERPAWVDADNQVDGDDEKRAEKAMEEQSIM